ncbi:redoxin family protein [Candidatus Parcubacteria bacterium]|nr:redoxin family protein [Candidatus Parcubacteria bacterium]
MSALKPYTLIAVVVLLAGTIYFINSNSVRKGGSSEPVSVMPRSSSGSNEVKKDTMPSKYLSAEAKSKRYELAKEVTTPDGFINTDGRPITISGLIGKKIILVDFWTYSCINCQRTTPYLNAWYEKYKDKGFVIIGVHTPEFEFEKDYNNVKAAVEKFGIKFPIVLDNDYSTWTAYKNQYWPRKYLIDIDGYIVYDHIGEGGYEETEQKIQEVLGERMAVLGENGTIDQSVTKEIPVPGGSRSPETYFGASRNQLLGNGTPGVAGDQKNLTIPAKLNLNALYLSGDWDITNEFAQNTSPETRIIYKYSAKDVFFVSQSNTETVIEVLRDGKPLGAEAGADAIKTSDGKTVVKIKEARLYKIIQDNQSEVHTLEFRIPKSGLKAFTFTFG